MFEGLNNHNNGKVLLKDIEGAINHLSGYSRGQKPIFRDPKAIIRFFRDMDTTESGGLNFRQFSLGVLRSLRHMFTVLAKNVEVLFTLMYFLH